MPYLGGAVAALADDERFVEGAPGDGAAIAAGHVAIGVVAVAGGLQPHATGSDLTDGVEATARPALAAVLVGADAGLGENVAEGVVGDIDRLGLAVAKVGIALGEAVEAVVDKDFGDALDGVAPSSEVAQFVVGQSAVETIPSALSFIRTTSFSSFARPVHFFLVNLVD